MKPEDKARKETTERQLIQIVEETARARAAPRGPKYDFYENKNLLNFGQREGISRQGETNIYEGESLSKINKFPRQSLELNASLQVANSAILNSHIAGEHHSQANAEVAKPEKDVRDSIVSENNIVIDVNHRRSIHSNGEAVSVSRDRTDSVKSATLGSSRNIIPDANEQTLEGTRRPSAFKINAMSLSQRQEVKKKSDIFSSTKDQKKVLVDSVLQSWVWTFLITSITLYTLFSDDVKIIFFDTRASLFFDIMVYICIGFFLIEIVLSIIADRTYFLSFYFFLDVISTLTMVLDLSYLSETSEIGNSLSQVNNIFRSTKTAKLGSRAGRIGRVIRIVGIFRVSKIFKEAEKVKQNKINRFDKDLKKKRVEREAEAKQIKQDFANLERLRKLMNSRRLKGLGIFNNPQTPQVGSEGAIDLQIEPENLQSPDKDSLLASPGKSFKFRNALSSALSRKFQKTYTNQESNSVSKPLKDNGNTNGTPNNQEMEKQGTIKKSALNVALLKAVSKFRKQGSQLKRAASEREAEKLKHRSKTLQGRTLHRNTIVGKVIIEKNTKILILVVLIMVLAFMLFNSTTWFQPSDSCDFDIRLIKDIVSTSQQLTQESLYQELIDSILYKKYSKMPLLEYSIPFYGYKYREKEYWSSMILNCSTNLDNSDASTIFIVYLAEDQTKLESLLNICKMIFITLIIFLGSYFFTSDANKLILHPIENIMCLVNMIAKDPEVSEQLLHLQNRSEENRLNEMKLVERAILKLGTLLMLVFGRAGNNVIYSNISNIMSDDIDIVAVGQSNMAIFGFCDIRNFTDMTEILEESIMPFVNNVARVVHSSVIKFLGSANKNIGDAFLLVWPLPEECMVSEVTEGNTDKLSQTNIFLERYAEAALSSFIEIIINLSKSKEVQDFAAYPPVQRRMPGYQVSMGFGLHMGWAIEGAIGSLWKIDASYLSPNVNISSRLEAATKQFGVPLLFSHTVFDVLSRKTKEYCRMVDRVTLKGSDEPIGLYTVDVNTSIMIKASVLKGAESPISTVRHTSKDIKSLYLKEDFNFNLETLVPALQLCYTHDEKFLGHHRRGVLLYLEGKFKLAKDAFEKALLLRPDDGPSKAIYQYLEARNFEAPRGWQGVRILTEK